MSEHQSQASLFGWAEYAIMDYPELEMMYAIPNGGHRNKSVAARLQQEGVQAGVWDISLDVPRGGFHGLKIEMKFGKNKLTSAQRDWQTRYNNYGYATIVCYSWTDAARGILDYLGYSIPGYLTE